MLSISKDKIDSVFELIGSKQPLYLPVDNNAGTADSRNGKKAQSFLQPSRQFAQQRTSSSQRQNTWFLTR